MKKYQYGKVTKHFKMPCYGYGDSPNPEVEYIKLQAIENQILAGTKGIKCCVFEDGYYKLIKDTSIEYKVELCGTGHKKAACGIINGLYFEEGRRTEWGNLKKGKLHYLYLTGSKNLFEDKTNFRAFSSTVERQLEKTACLMAVVDLRKEKEIIDTKPKGKIVTSDIIKHAYQDKDAHGEELNQTRIKVSENLTFEINENSTKNDGIINIIDNRKIKVPTIKTNGEIVLRDKRTQIQLSEDGNDVLSTGSQSIIGAINEISELKRTTLNFHTAKEGVLLDIETNQKVEAVEVHQRFIGGIKNLGNIAIGYYEDEAVENENEFIVYNDGKEDISMKAIIYYR